MTDYIGCIFCTQEFADKYVVSVPSESACINDDVLEHYVFIGVSKPEDIWNKCKPTLLAFRQMYGKGINAYLVSLKGLRPIGTCLYRTERYAWFDKTKLYEDLVIQLNDIGR